MTTVDAVLKKYGNGLAPNDFADELEAMLEHRRLADPRALSEHDRQTLGAVGVPAEDVDRRVQQPVVETAADLLTESEAARPAAEVAARLGRSVNRIRGAIADGSLYGMKLGRSWLLPDWQFTDVPGPLPHLRRVIAAIPDGASAVSVRRFITEPSEELYIAGAAVSPRQWLLAGQDPGPVVEMAQQLYTW